MCLNPIRMVNPHFPRTYVSGNTHNVIDRVTGEVTKKQSHVIRYTGPKSFKHNSEHAFINIPCGHCSECVSIKQQSYVQRVYMETKYNHVFFATLTYDNKHLPVTEVLLPKSTKPFTRKTSSQEETLRLFNDDGSLNGDAAAKVLELSKQRLEAFESCREDFCTGNFYQAPELTDITDEYRIERIPYADIHHLQLLFKRMRDNNSIGRPFRYIAVTERGKQRARPHVHIMFFIPKHEGDTVATCNSLNEALRDMLLHYWSTNVGTRKNPVYERNFTLRERWIGNKLYRNFDCHYVNPVLTTNGVNDVTYYVTKYMFKESKREEELRKMLFKYLVTRDGETGEIDYTLFYQTWDLVKSRVVSSKGLGLDAEFVSIVRTEYKKKGFYEYCQESVKNDISLMEDLPGDDFVLTPVSEWKAVERKTRILVPNFDIMEEIRKNSMKEKTKGRFVFVNYVGEHFSLSKYYQDRCLREEEFVDLYYSTDPRFYSNPFRADELDQATRERKQLKYRKSCDLIDAHDIMDTRFNEVELSSQDIDPYSVYKGHSHKLITLSTPKIPIGS